MHDGLQKFDPASFEIVKNGLYKIAEEMRVVLAKTAYSPLLKSAGDYSCGIFNARGEMVAQGPDLPIHLGSMPDAVRAVVARFASDVRDGDAFVHNDPYFGERLQSAPLSRVSHLTCMTAMFSFTTIHISAAAICRM